MGSAIHLFSVDVEEHFQVSAFERYAPRDTWDSHPSRVVPNTQRLLDLMDETATLATFFTLGWVADRQPALVREIVARGHEVASHSYWHARVTTLTPDQFREEVRRSKRSLEDAAGVEVTGYRAPSFSIVPGLEWTFEILCEEGYRYDSSLFPIRRRGYGYPGARPDPHALVTRAGSLQEFPVATVSAGPFRLPAGGGGYLRHLPLRLIRTGLDQAAARGVPAMLYIHPWEVDPDQPRLPVGRLTTFRHYRGLDRTLDRLRRLMTEFTFTSVARWQAAVPS
jgi:polysaccharide deacetylase family protein (PEP-CTERM system associated)